MQEFFVCFLVATKVGVGFFWLYFLCFLIAKGIQGARIYFGFDIVFYYSKGIQNVTKKNSIFL
jgi:hypothetical protein